MISINDPYDLVSALFNLYPEFIKNSNSNSDVDILPVFVKESFQHSDRPTIFINTEPNIDCVNTRYHQQILAKPNCAWAVSGYGTRSEWPLKKWFLYLSNNIMTVKVNPPMPNLQSGCKPWLATALLGGWSMNRSLLLYELKKLGILDQCLVNYYERTHDPLDIRNQSRKIPELYFNMRTSVLDHLDDPVFLNLAFKNENQTISINTCVSLPETKNGQHGWVSQLVPWKIYNSAYISIIVENDGFKVSDLFFISEKISRPLLVGHPFVVFGCVGYLAELRKLGFQTFSLWIDESYDLVEDPTQRIQAIALSVKKFSEMSDQKRQLSCEEMQTVTDHNRRLLLDNEWMYQSLRKTILNLKKA